MPPLSRKLLKQLCMIFLISATLTACGIRPGALDRPVGEDGERYPHTYPNPDLNTHP